MRRLGGPQRLPVHLRALPEPRPRNPPRRGNPARGRPGPRHHAPARRPTHHRRGRLGAGRGQGAGHRRGSGPDQADRRRGHGRGSEGPVRPAGGLRRQHHGVHARGMGPAPQRRRHALADHADERQARPGGRARLLLQGGPAGAQALHPRVQARHHRCRRRRRRRPGRRLQTGADRGRHGLRIRQGTDLRRRDRRPRLPRRTRPGPGPCRGARGRAPRLRRHRHQ